MGNGDENCRDVARNMVTENRCGGDVTFQEQTHQNNSRTRVTRHCNKSSSNLSIGAGPRVNGNHHHRIVIVWKRRQAAISPYIFLRGQHRRHFCACDRGSVLKIERTFFFLSLSRFTFTVASAPVCEKPLAGSEPAALAGCKLC
jgi:hypothetical protein